MGSFIPCPADSSRRLYARGLTYQFKRLNPPEVRPRILFEYFRAERPAQRDHPIAVPDAGEPVAARNCLLAHRALHVWAVKIAGVEVHADSFLGSRALEPV